MANPKKGEVAFEAGGVSYTLKLGTYAQAMLERRSKMSMAQFFSRGEDQYGVDDILSVLYVGLYQKHKLTEEQVGDLIDELGMEKVSEMLAEAIQLANPREAGPTTESPTAAKADGTGTTS